MEYKLVIGGKTGESVCLVGKTFNESKLIKSIIRRYFPKGNIMYDTSRLPRFLEEIGGTSMGERLWVEPAVRESYREYIENRTVKFRQCEESVILEPQGRPPPSIWRVILGYCTNPRSGVFVVKNPLRLWRINTELKWFGGYKVTEKGFEDWFERWSVNKVAIELTLEYRNQIAVYHYYRSQSLELKRLLDEYVDDFKLMRNPERLDELRVRMSELSVELWEDPAAVEHSEHLRGLAQETDSTRAMLKTSGFRAELYRYQLYGVSKLVYTSRLMLADDMGLGKTLQSIGASELLLHTGKVERVLIVCPSSLKVNWQREIELSTGEKATIVDGTPQKRLTLYMSQPRYLIINYELVFRDIELLIKQNFGLLILDEAQRVKNYQTKSSKALQKIKTPYCFVLTGTPLENNIEELYNISRFIDPYAIAPNIIRFHERYCRTDKFGQVSSYENVHEIRRKLSGLMLRRTKSEVLTELPPALEEVRWLEPYSEQREVLRKLRVEVQEILDGVWGQEAYNKVISYYQKMRDVCDSLEMYDANMKGSSKLDELVEIVREQVVSNGRQAIVFTQWTRMGEILQRTFNGLGLRSSYLHGSLNQEARQREIDTFVGGASKIFIATDAGGTGLNLQVANLIVNYDIPYNPAKIAQRIGRANRHGQTDVVDVVYLLLTGTIEERVWDVVRKRQQVFDEVIDYTDKDIVIDKNSGTKAMWEEIFR